MALRKEGLETRYLFAPSYKIVLQCTACSTQSEGDCCIILVRQFAACGHTCHTPTEKSFSMNWASPDTGGSNATVPSKPTPTAYARRYTLGVAPVHLRNALWKFGAEEKPKSNDISSMLFMPDCKSRMAKSRRRPSFMA